MEDIVTREDIWSTIAKVYSKMDDNGKMYTHIWEIFEHISGLLRSKLGHFVYIDEEEMDNKENKRKISISVATEDAWCESKDRFEDIVKESIAIVFDEDYFTIKSLEFSHSKGDTNCIMPTDKQSWYYEYDKENYMLFGRDHYNASFIVEVSWKIIK